MKNLGEFLKEKKYFGVMVEEATKVPAKKATRPRSKGIQKNELDMMAESIKTIFGIEAFMNKDFASKGLLEKWNLSNRQTPSRLKKLVEAGVLEDLGGSPKSYKVVS